MRTNACLRDFGRGDREFRQSVIEDYRNSCPKISVLRHQGSLEAAVWLSEQADEASLWWPEDHSWYVVTEIDYAWMYTWSAMCHSLHSWSIHGWKRIGPDRTTVWTSPRTATTLRLQRLQEEAPFCSTFLRGPTPAFSRTEKSGGRPRSNHGHSILGTRQKSNHEENDR